MIRLSRRWRWRLDQRLRETGLTQARWTTLLQIARGGDGLSQARLADHIGVEQPTLARMLDSLEKVGLVERRANPCDRRANTVHLTDKAAGTIGRIEDIARTLRDEATGGIAEAELERCITIIETVADRLDGLGEGRGR